MIKEEMKQYAEKYFTTSETSRESVNHPSYYGGNDTYETIKVCEAWGLDEDAYLFNVVKYISRAGKKDKNKLIEDLEKASWYLNRKIDRLKDKPY